MNEITTTTSQPNLKARARFILLTLFLVIAYSTVLLSATIYVDPSNSASNQNGTIDNPYNSWSKVSFANGNTYLQKSGTTFNTSAGISFSGKSGITLGAYGSGSQPKIVASGTGNHIINVASSSNIVVKGLEVTSTGTWTSGVYINGSGASNNLIDDCTISKVMWGVRVITASAGNKIMNSTIHTIGDDGIYVKDASTIEIGFSNIYNINTKYLTNTDQAYSAGDGIQLASTNTLNFNIHDNTIDHSSMGNKFCIIAWGDNYNGIIENNVLIGNATKVTSAIYLSPTTGTVTVRYNTIKNSNYGIYSYVKNLDVYYNSFSSNKNAINILNGYSLNARNNVFYNNTSTAISSTPGTSVVLKNNIFNITSGARAISTNGTISSNNNLFNIEGSGFINGQSTLSGWKSATGNDANSMVNNPGFVSPGSEDFKLQSTSAAINKGANVSLTRDFYGNSVSGTPDIGTHEVGGGASTATNAAPVINGQSFTVAPTATIGTAVGTVVASDPNAGQALTYSIISGNTNTVFAISSTGKITVAKTLPLQAFNIVVKVTDNGSPVMSAQATLTINVTSSTSSTLNKAPIVQASTFSVVQKSAYNAFVGKIQGSDPNAGQTLTCAIVSGNTGNAFALNPTTGVITVKTSAAITVASNPLFKLSVRVTDNGVPSMSTTQVITIKVVYTKSSAEIGTIEEFQEPKEMRVYPNPSIDGKFSVAFGKTFDNVKLEVYDLTGRLVKNITVTESSKSVVDMGANPSGAYLIRIDTGSEKKTLKAIKN